MKKFLFCLFVICAFAIGYNVYHRSKEKANMGKRNVYAVLPLSGPMGQNGKDAKQVMDYYYKKENYPFNLIYIDSETNPSKAITALQQKTINEERPIVITALSSVTEAISPYLQKKDGFLFAISACNKDIPNFVRLHSDAEGIMEPVVSYLKQNYHKVAVVYVEDEFGRLERNYLSEQLKNAEISMDEISISLKTLDVRTEVLKIKDYDPDAVVIMGVPSQGYINIMHELLAQNFEGQIFLDASITSPHVRKQLSDGIMGASLLLEAEGPKSSTQKQFQEDLDFMGFPVYYMPIEAVDAMNLIKYTLENNMQFSQNSYEKIGSWEGISGSVEFLHNGNTVYKYILVQYKEGQFVPVESEVE